MPALSFEQTYSVLYSVREKKVIFRFEKNEFSIRPSLGKTNKKISEKIKIKKFVNLAGEVIRANPGFSKIVESI